MVNYILKLFFVNSLILHAQSAELMHDDTHESISTTSQVPSSKESINHKSDSHSFPSSTVEIPTNSFIIKPLSTVYSSLLSDLYTSYTFAPKPKHKKALSETSLAPKASTNPLWFSFKLVKPLNENTSSLAPAKIDSSTKTVVETSSISTRFIEAINIDCKPTTPPKLSPIPSTELVTENSSPVLSFLHSSNNIEHYTIPMDPPALNNDILKGMPSRSFILKRPTLPSHSTSKIHADKHNYIYSAIPSPSYSVSDSASNVPLHAAQIKSESSLFSYIIPSILNKPQQIHQQISSSLNGKFDTTTNFAAQSVSSDTKPSASSSSQTTIKVIPKETSDPEAHISPCYRRGRKVEFSQYWIPKENEWDETNGGRRVFLGGDAKMKLFDRNNKEIGMVPVDMYQKCRMEGTVS